jgi:hypothetical protein
MLNINTRWARVHLNQLGDRKMIASAFKVTLAMSEAEVDDLQAAVEESLGDEFDETLEEAWSKHRLEATVLTHTPMDLVTFVI